MFTEVLLDADEHSLDALVRSVRAGDISRANNGCCPVYSGLEAAADVRGRCQELTSASLDLYNVP